MHQSLHSSPGVDNTPDSAIDHPGVEAWGQKLQSIFEVLSDTGDLNAYS